MTAQAMETRDGGLTRPTFPEAALSQDELDGLLAAPQGLLWTHIRTMSNNVEAIYPLSPMQEGMLFHTVYAPGTGVYVNQVAYTFGELRAHLKGRLPEYMVPSAVVVLESLPLTPSGKVARRALPAPEYAAAEEAYVAPRTPVEEVLAEIWAQVLRVDRVGAHDSFFDLGGHSLVAMRVLARIHATFGLEISIRDVFSMPTLEAMAGEIERRIYEDIATISDDEAEQLLAANLVAG